jgi:hypothetical protein
MTTNKLLSDEQTNDALRSIGLIAVYAANLEVNLARLASFASDAIDYKAAIRLSNKQRAQAVRAGLQNRRNLNGTAKRDLAGRHRAIEWADEAVRLLQRRGDLMHSEWIIARRISDRRAPTELLSHHLSSGRRSPVDPESLGLLAEQLGGHASRYNNIWRFAMRGTVGRTAAEWDALFSPSVDQSPVRASDARE